MYNFIEKGIRGGISNISRRHSIAMKTYDRNKEKNIVYLMQIIYTGGQCNKNYQLKIKSGKIQVYLQKNILII